jgi:hypothetical protein
MEAAPPVKVGVVPASRVATAVELPVAVDMSPVMTAVSPVTCTWTGRVVGPARGMPAPAPPSH